MSALPSFQTIHVFTYNCSICLSNVLVLKANDTDDFQCDCWHQAMKGKYELDPDTWSVNCSTSFAIRNSKKSTYIEFLCLNVCYKIVCRCLQTVLGCNAYIVLHRMKHKLIKSHHFIRVAVTNTLKVR